MMVGTENGVGPERERVLELAASQIDNYLRQPEELVSHFNREGSALDGYRGRQLLELLQNADDAVSAMVRNGPRKRQDTAD